MFRLATMIATLPKIVASTNAPTSIPPIATKAIHVPRGPSRVSPSSMHRAVYLQSGEGEAETGSGTRACCVGFEAAARGAQVAEVDGGRVGEAGRPIHIGTEAFLGGDRPPPQAGEEVHEHRDPREQSQEAVEDAAARCERQVVGVEHPPEPQ